MELTIQGKQISVGDALRTHVTDKLEDLNKKYFNHGTYATVTFSREGHGHGLIKSHIHIQIGKEIVVMADAIEGDPYLAFETSAEKVTQQMRRYKKRLRDHHRRMEEATEQEIAARNYVIDTKDEADELPKGKDPLIIAEMTTAIQTMSVSEAVMRMDLSGQTAMMFRNAKHNELNMVYRRPDGNIGWLDPHIAESRARKTEKKAEPKTKTAVKSAARAKEEPKQKAKARRAR
jgi:ribosomal subunit interface protein